MPNFCGSRSLASSKRSISCLDSEPRAPSANSVYLARSSMPRVNESLCSLFLADAHVAGRDADDLAVLAIEHFGRREPRIDLDAERFRLGGEPAAHIAERHDEVAVVRHQRRQQEIRQAQAAGRAEPVEAIVGDRRLDRSVFAAPFGEQPVETDRIDHGAGEDVGADLGAFFHHHDAELGVELLEADRGRKPGRPGADDHNVEFHRLAVGQIAHGPLESIVPAQVDTGSPQKMRTTQNSGAHRFARAP